MKKNKLILSVMLVVTIILLNSNLAEASKIKSFEKMKIGEIKVREMTPAEQEEYQKKKTKLNFNSEEEINEFIKDITESLNKNNIKFDQAKQKHLNQYSLYNSPYNNKMTILRNTQYEGYYKGYKTSIERIMPHVQVSLETTYRYQKAKQDIIGPILQPYKFISSSSRLTMYGGVIFLGIDNEKIDDFIYPDGSAIDITASADISIEIGKDGWGRILTLPIYFEQFISSLDIN